MSAHVSIGIDLGTSNSAVAIAAGDSAPARVIAVSQLLAPGQIGERDTLPSALYIPQQGEFPDAALTLPWAAERGAPSAITGHFARSHGALRPDRMVASAKSWLSNKHVDPRAPQLPWGAALPEGQLSALEASTRYLLHLREGLNHAITQQGQLPIDPAEATVVITVPASFDEVARQLTNDAAHAAGFGEVVLLEEPQAAFYAWTESLGSAWRNQVSNGDLILVCDVGGGTTDFSLIAVTDADGELGLERVAVGEHILLGGDNMDLALAYVLQSELEADGDPLDEFQFLALIHAASQAKVALLTDPSLQSAPIAIPSQGSGLLAGMRSTALTRDALFAVLIDGFFESVPADAIPDASAGTALQDFGLPYAADPVITRHLAHFLQRSLGHLRKFAADRGWPQPEAVAPSAVLFNGGVFKAEALRTRVIECMAHWHDGTAPVVLEGYDPDLAVARGAAIYGRNRASGKGLRIRAGTAHSYYIGLESSRPAVPGFKPPLQALCVVPQGMEEGSALTIDAQTFGLLTGKPAVFRFFASANRPQDAAGSRVANAAKVLDEAAQLEVTLPPMPEFADGQPVPVQLHAVVTELGNLELFMQHTASEQRWKVDFKVRME